MKVTLSITHGWTQLTRSRNSSGITDRISAPSTTPRIEPMPPSTTMARTMIDSIRVNDSGLTKPW
ncbi:hypothetical protein D3C80_1995200 [compost metagenome]